ncbi:MAG: class I SAM-dependent methyltransferase [Gemmatimonadota bacterium]|nr:class I SAM-dependent methyltransferase [Gemmatimonadota bacterium]
MANDYSEAWFDVFLPPGGGPQVEVEVEFIRRHLDVNAFPSLLDVACGTGRHAAALAPLGYEILGVDRSVQALESARTRAPGVTFAPLDMSELDSLADDFDGVLSLWQSFGYGSEAENLRVLAAMGRRLRPGGRLVLDVYNRAALPTVEHDVFETPEGHRCRRSSRLDGNRFQVSLQYEGRTGGDEFDWQVYSVEELTQALIQAGFRPLFTCTWFDADRPPTAGARRMQTVAERPGSRS